MISREIKLIIAAIAGIVIAITSILGVEIVFWWAPHDKVGTFAEAAFCLSLTFVFLHYLSKCINNFWPRGDSDQAAKVLKVISSQTSLMTFIAFLASFIVYIVTRLLFLEPDRLTTPLQPILTFLLSGMWITYVFYSLFRLMTVERNQGAGLAKFSAYSVAAAISLSIYFLLPLEWLVNAGNRAYVRVVLGQEASERFAFAPVHNSAVEWLQTTAVPSIVAIGFGFVTAYVTSLIWYEYYHSIAGAGVNEVRPSRRGRDRTHNDEWFGRLKQSEQYVVMAGATLGGWFGQWSEFRSQMRLVLSKESIESVTIILPDPGSAFFQRRRKDETRNEPLLAEDPISRLSTAIELLCLALPGTASIDGKEEALRALIPELDFEEFKKFLPAFEKRIQPHRETYDKISDNLKFSQQIADNEILGSDKKQGKLRVLFTTGSLMGLNIFDAELIYTPYLPGVKDKDCPQFAIKCYAPLGVSIRKSLDAMEECSFTVRDRCDAAAMAFRMWKLCQSTNVQIEEIADAPPWLFEKYV